MSGKMARRFNDLKYRYKIAILTLVAGLLPVAMITAYMQAGTARLLRERELQAMEKAVAQAVETMENQVQIYENLINYLSYSQDLRSVLRQQDRSDYDMYLLYTDVVDPLLQMPQIYHQEIEKITIYSDNVEVPHGTMLAPLEELKKEPWYGRLRDSELLEWYVKRGAERKIIAFRKFYGEGEVSAVLAMQLDYGRMLSPFTNLFRDNTGGLVCDEDGNVICSGYSLDGEFRPAQAESLPWLREHYVCMEQTMDGTGWAFCLYRPEEIITGSARSLMQQNIPIVSVCLILLGVLGYFFSRRLVSCLEQLTENMNQVQRGLRRVTVGSDARDEVGTLIRAFRRMMEELNKLISEVYEAKIELQHTEMRALQAQINPHFLYNSLSIINWKAIEAQEDEISRVTLDLSTYYRTSLNRGETMTTVENEVNNIRAYLRIQLIMHDHNFQVREEIDGEVFSCRIPKLILQPLVENAIDHGLDASEKEDRRLVIVVRREGEDLVFQVKDNGNGMSQETAGRILGYQSSGYGVHNVYDRIKLLYREKGEMKVESREGEGTCVEIRVPVKASEEGPERMMEIGKADGKNRENEDSGKEGGRAI